MPIPVYINQTEAGTLTVTRDGLYTVFEAEAPGCGGLVRLWVHGGGRSACLGVMQPWSGGLWLRRRLSRRELEAFPDPIELVSDREEADNLHNTINITQEAPGEESPAQPPEEAPAPEPEMKAESLHNAETGARACPWPAEPPEEGLLWYRRTDGSLVAFDGVSSLVAIPSALRGAAPRGAERVIEGQKYLVFRY